MFDEIELEKLVISLKVAETSENFKQLLDNYYKTSKYYDEIVRVSEQETIDKEILFLEFRGWLCFKLEQEILSYVKGVF